MITAACSQQLIHQLKLGEALSHNPKWRRRAEQVLNKATELAPWKADGWLGLGRLYKRGGLRKKAHKMFKQALDAESTNQEALEELANSGPNVGNSLGGVFRRMLKTDVGGGKDSKKGKNKEETVGVG